MKKIIALLLMLAVSAAVLTACSAAPEATVPSTGKDAQQETTQPEQTEATHPQQEEPTEAATEAPADDLSTEGYESAVIGRDGKEITVYFDPDCVKKNSYVNSDVEVAFVGLKETAAITLKVSSYADADEYINSMVAALTEDSNYTDVALSGVEEVQYGTFTVKAATVTYNVKAYELDKPEEYTPEQLEQMPYTLQEETATYKMMELSDGTLLQVIASGKDSAIEKAFEGIVIKPAK